MTLTIDGRPQIVLDGADLDTVGVLRSSAGGESPTLTVSLDARRVAVLEVLDPPPLRAAAVLSDGGTILFSGLVQAVRLGQSPTITLES